MFSSFSRFFRGKPHDGPVEMALADPLTMVYIAYFRPEPGHVPTAEELTDEIVTWLARLDQPFGNALTDWIVTGLLRVHVSPREQRPSVPLSLLKVMGIGEEEGRRFSGATHAALCTSPDRLRSPRIGLWAAFTAARVVAHVTDGVAMDVAIPRLLRIQPMDDELAADFRLFLPEHIVVPFSRDRRGLCWLTTKGMSKFGLPELEIVDVPPNLPDSLVPVVNGIAYLLVNASINRFDDDPGKANTLRIGPEIRISMREIAEAYGDNPMIPAEGVRGWTTIRLEYRPGRRGRESYLRLGPPRHFNEGRSVWLNSMLVDLLGVKREIHKVADDDEVMAKAHARAVATLPQFKKRFRAGPEPGEVYFVKHGFPRHDNDHHEFMWVIVKTWSGGRIKGILANDPTHRIDLRSGQPITLTEADVFDWLLTLPDGTQQGGFTNLAAAEQGRAEDDNEDAD